VVAGAESTRSHILWYTVVLGLVTLLPSLTGQLGWVYGVLALALSGEFFRRALMLKRSRSDVVAMRLFRFSIVYLFAVFMAMVVDRILPAVLP
jgi:protoheme IX farnesyltransferase